MKPSRLLLGVPLLLLAAAPSAAAPTRDWHQSQRAITRKALQQLKQDPRVRITWPRHRLRPSAIRGLRWVVPGKTPAQRARAALRRLPGLVATAPGHKLRLQDVSQTRQRTVVRFRLVYRGVPVYGAQVLVTLDQADRVIALTSSADPLHLPSVTPVVTALNAASIAAAQEPPTQGRRLAPSARWAQLTIRPLGQGRLMYAVRLPFSLGALGRIHWVDATTGRYLGWTQGTVTDTWARGSQAHHRGVNP